MICEALILLTTSRTCISDESLIVDENIITSSIYKSETHIQLKYAIAAVVAIETNPATYAKNAG